jgi:hypothetical protein
MLGWQWCFGRRGVALVAGALVGAAFSGCGSDDGRAPPNSGLLDGVTGGHGGSAGASGSPGGGGREDAGPRPNCGAQVCKGEGTECIDGACRCKDGYLPENDAAETLRCAVDRNCVKLRYLEDHCRVQLRGAPAVGLFFAVDYCAGTAVLPEDLGDVASAFQVLEDDLPLQTESRVTFMDLDVESHVLIALDVSESILNNTALLREVTGELQDFVNTLGAGGDITVGLLGFARSTRLIVPLTRDVSRVTAALASIRTDPLGYLEPIFQTIENGVVRPANLNGTVLVEATERGIRELERMQGFRRVVSDNGILTSSTLVVVTDGGDSDNRPAPPLVTETLVNVITVGVGTEIDGNLLASLGRDGAFLGPDAESREEAFDAVSRRVKEHPERAYFLGYCSAATRNEHRVTVNLAGKETRTSALCNFNANTFGSGSCSDPSYFRDACTGVTCGTMFACGACRDDQCCVAGPQTCGAPQVTPNCNGQDELCEPDGGICRQIEGTNPPEHECRAHTPLGETCNVDGDCEPGIGHCSPPDPAAPNVKECLPVTRQTGDACADTPTTPRGALCEGQNCSRRTAENIYYCAAAPARMFEPCSNDLGNARCELGTSCEGTCRLRGPVGLFWCDNASQCATGECDTSARICAFAPPGATPACHYTWADKLD